MMFDVNLIMQFLYPVLSTLFAWIAAIVCGFYIGMSLIVSVEALFSSE